MNKLLTKIVIGLLILVNVFLIGTVIYDYADYIGTMHGDINRLKIKLSTLESDVYRISRISSGAIQGINDLSNEILQTKNIIANLEVVPKLDIDKILKSSVTLLGNKGMGAGTIIKKTDNYMLILSCYHIIADIIESDVIKKNYFIAYTNIQEFEEGRYDFGSRIYEAKLIKSDKEQDMVLLKMEVKDDNLDVIEISNKNPKIGDTIYTIGNPLGAERTLSKGILSNIIDGFYITDNTITFGNSGGSLLNENGELIGIPARLPCYNVILGDVPESGLGESITLDRIKIFLNDTEMNETKPLKFTPKEIEYFFKQSNKGK